MDYLNSTFRPPVIYEYKLFIHDNVYIASREINLQDNLSEIYRDIIDSYELHTNQKYIRSRISRYENKNKRSL